MSAEIAVIGTGLMGKPIAETLARSNYKVIAYNRTREKAESLRSSGVKVAMSARSAVESSECALLMLSDASAIREALLPPNVEIDFHGRTIIQMGTIAPMESRELARTFNALGASYFEAPVLGSIPEASIGKLITMVGASREQFSRWEKILACLSSRLIYVGFVGQAAALKLAMNQLIASLTSAFAASLAFIELNEVRVEDFMEVLRASALHAATFDKKLDRMVQGNYSHPNFPVRHLAKDMDLFCLTAEQAGMTTASMDGVMQVLRATIDSGMANEDYSAIFESIRRR